MIDKTIYFVDYESERDMFVFKDNEGKTYEFQSIIVIDKLFGEKEILDKISEVEDLIIGRCDKLEKQNAGLQALFTTIDDKLTDIYEVMFRKRGNRESIITVFKVIFGSDSVITFDGNDLVVKTNNDRAIDMNDINIKLMKIGKRCELSKTRIPNDRYNISYVFKITRW